MPAAPVDARKLIEFATAVYAGQGVPEADARLIADTLVQADLWGHQSHGVLRLGWYLDRLRNKVMNPVTTPEFVVDAGALAVIDGHDGVGHVLTKLAAEEAIKRAKAHGIGAVGVRMSNHFGTCMYYTLMGARAGCVMLLTSNGGPAMAPWGGRKKIVGTNPWSIAAPAGRHAPFVVDMANTGVARGKIYLARNKRQPIPRGLGDQRRRRADHRSAGGHRRHHPADGRAQGLRDRGDGRHDVRRADRQRLPVGGAQPVPDGREEQLRPFHGGDQHRGDAAAGRSSTRAWSSGSPRSSRCRWRRASTRCSIRARWRRATTHATASEGIQFPDDTIADLQRIAGETGLQALLPVA